MDLRIIIGLSVLMLMVSASGITEVETEVSDVVIYPQSVALVTESGNEGQGSDFMAGINRNAYMDSIRVSGASEMSVSVEPVIYPLYEYQTPVKQLLEQVLGKSVKIGESEGILDWIGESWIGISGENFIVMPISSVTSLEANETLQEPDEAEDQKAETNVTWVSSGGKSVDISYLANGLSWTPVYFLDAGTSSSRFEFWAKVTNNFEDLDANVKLIGGEINIQGGGSLRYYDTYAQNGYA
jgi:hypothetical protein